MQTLDSPLQKIVLRQQLFVIFRLGEQLFDFLFSRFTRKDFRESLLQLLSYRHISIGKINLAQKTDVLFSAHRNSAALVAVQITHLNIPGNQPQKRRFSASVSADNCNFFCVVNFEIHTV